MSGPLFTREGSYRVLCRLERTIRCGQVGLQLNITDLIPAQHHEQHYGIEHMAVETDDYAGTLARLRKNGVRILEETAAQQQPARLLRRMSRRRADGDN